MRKIAKILNKILAEFEMAITRDRIIIFRRDVVIIIRYNSKNRKDRILIVESFHRTDHSTLGNRIINELKENGVTAVKEEPLSPKTNGLKPRHHKDHGCAI